jgi:hypothetical protein
MRLEYCTAGQATNEPVLRAPHGTWNRDRSMLGCVATMSDKSSVSVFLPRMMRLWSCAQPRSDARSAQVTPDGVADKSTGGPSPGDLRPHPLWHGPA